MKKIKRTTFRWADSFDHTSSDADLSFPVKTNVGDDEGKPMKNLSALDEDNSIYSDFQNKIERLKRETHLHIGQQVVPTQISFVESSQIWNGRVERIHEHTFTARLEEQSGRLKTRIVEMDKSLVNERDWNVFFTEGFEFEWVFQRVNKGGTISKRREIRFTPVPHYLESEIKDMVEREMDAFSYLFSDDD